MSEAESRIKCGAEIYSSNNQNNNEGGSEEESEGKNWTNSTLPAPQHEYTSPVRPFVSNSSNLNSALPNNHNHIHKNGDQDKESSPNSPNSKSVPQVQTPSLKSPTTTKKIRLPLPSATKSCPGKNHRQDSSIPVGIAVARQRHVVATTSATSTVLTMSSQNSNQSLVSPKSKRASPNRPPPSCEAGTPGNAKSAARKMSLTALPANKSNTTTTSTSVKKPVPSVNAFHSEPIRSSSARPSEDGRSPVMTPTIPPGLTSPADALQQRQLLYAAVERGRLAENGGIGGKPLDFSAFTGGFGHNPHYRDWASQLNVPHLPPGFNTAATAAAFMQQPQLTMHHPEIPLQLSQSYGYNLSPYLYSGYPAESLLQYEQFFRQQAQQQAQQQVQQISREEQIRQQQIVDYDVRSASAAPACRSLTPVPSHSPRISIPSPSPHHPHWPTDIYQHHTPYFTSSTATLSPRSLTSSTPSPVTVHDMPSHSYLLARKCITPNPSGKQHFPFSSPFSPSIAGSGTGARDVWKDVKISPISTKQKVSPKPPAFSPPGESEPEAKKNPIARHDFRRMESLIEKREDESTASPTTTSERGTEALGSGGGDSSIDEDELDVEDNSSSNNSLSRELEVKVNVKPVTMSIENTIKKVCDGMELSVPETKKKQKQQQQQHLKSTTFSAAKTKKESKESTKKAPKKKPAVAVTRPSPKTQLRSSAGEKKKQKEKKNDDTQLVNKGNSSEKYFIPVKREFYEFNNSRVGKAEEEICSGKYSTKALNNTSSGSRKRNTSSTLNSRKKAGGIVPVPSSEVQALALSSIDKNSKSKSIPVDISRVKKEIYANPGESNSISNRKSAAGENPYSWGNQRLETQGCSADTLPKSSQQQNHLEYFGPVEFNKMTTTDLKCDMSSLNHQDGNNGEHHNITVTVNLPPPTLADGTFSPTRTNSSSTSADSEIPSFPKIVISSAESHLNLLATVAQEIGPYISMNTNRSPRRYESLIQIEPSINSPTMSERRESFASTSTTSALSRLSIDENANFSPTLSPGATSGPLRRPTTTTPAIDHDLETLSPLGHGTTTHFEEGIDEKHNLPYQLKIPHIIPRIQAAKKSKPVKKEKDKKAPKEKEKPKKISEKKPRVVAKVRPTGNASTNLTKKPKSKGLFVEKKLITEASSGIKQEKESFISKKSKSVKKVSAVVQSQSQQLIKNTIANPSIYDFEFDDSKPNLEPLYNRLEKHGQSSTTTMAFQKPRILEDAKEKEPTLPKTSTPVSIIKINPDLKPKSSSVSRSSSKDKLKNPITATGSPVKRKIKTVSSPKADNNSSDKPKKPRKSLEKSLDRMAEKRNKIQSSKEKEKEIPKKKPKKQTGDDKTVPNKTAPSSALAAFQPSMQIQSFLSSLTVQGHDSSSNESSAWVADPAHAVKAVTNISPTTATTTPIFPRRTTSEEKVKQKPRKAMKPSKLSLLNGDDKGQGKDKEVKSSSAEPQDTTNTLKSQLKSFVHFTAKKKNGQHNSNHHHIKPCLKAEPEFKEEVQPSSEESEVEDIIESDLKVPEVPATPSPAKPIKIRKPSIDMNIFSRRVMRNSEDGNGSGKSAENLKKEEAAAELEWNENVTIAGVEEMLDEMRILTEIQGLFYTGKLNALEPPDVYGVTLDNERGAPPHLIYSAEEVLEKCVREAKPWKPSQLPHGLRICAYWSPQYSGLYPGKVSTDYDGITDLVPVEFDDGDTGVIKIAEIRLLASNHPIREYDPNPLLTLEKKHRKRRHSSATGSQISECNGLHEDADCGESYCAKVAKMKESEEDTEDSEDDNLMQGSSSKSLWTWSGLGYRRPGTKKNRLKEFFHGIQRGDEVINVGDSALFISNGNVRPFLGRIERFWEKKGKKIVNVRWFYHPEEVKTRKKLTGIKFPGALFESPHIDENDVQTIARKCEVLPFEKFREKYGDRFTSKAGRSLTGGHKKGASPKDTYYLAGYYDPYTYNLQLNDLK